MLAKCAVLVVLLLAGTGLRAQDYPYIAADFYHRHVEVPQAHAPCSD